MEKLRALGYALIGRYEGDYQPTEDPQDIWNEENVDVDSRKLKGDWRAGKNINEQLSAIVNNRQLGYRMMDCCSNPLLAFVSLQGGFGRMSDLGVAKMTNLRYFRYFYGFYGIFTVFTVFTV